MTTSAPAAVSEIDLWRQQTRMTRDVVGVNLGGLGHEDSLVQPRPGGNCLNWSWPSPLGLRRSASATGPAAGHRAKDPGALRARRSAIEDGTEAIGFDKLVTSWKEAIERVDAGLADLAPDVLDRPAQSPSGNPNETVRTLLTTVMFHQAYPADRLRCSGESLGRKAPSASRQRRLEVRIRRVFR